MVVLWNLLVEEGALAAIIGRLRLVEDFFNGKRSAWRDLVTGYCSERVFAIGTKWGDVTRS